MACITATGILAFGLDDSKVPEKIQIAVAGILHNSIITGVLPGWPEKGNGGYA
jgi:hypothetical protein